MSHRGRRHGAQRGRDTPWSERVGCSVQTVGWVLVGAASAAVWLWLWQQNVAEVGEFDAAARTLARVPAGLLRPTAAAKLLHALVDAAEAARVDEADGADDAAAAAVAALPELERAVEVTSHKLVAIAARASLLADDPAAALAPLVARSSARTLEKARKRLETATGGGHDAAIALLE